MTTPDDEFEKLLAEAFGPGDELSSSRPGADNGEPMMGAPDDEFEKLLSEALDPGEIELSSAQRSTLLAAFAKADANPVEAEAAELEEFTALLADALDPGEIAFEDEERRELIRQMTGAAAGDNLTAWALGEMPSPQREQLERRMEVNASLRAEALSYRRFCNRMGEALPALAGPGWWERTKLRYVVFGSPRRSTWVAAAAAVALLLSILPKVQEDGGQVAHQGTPTAPRIVPAPAPVAPVTPMVVVENVAPQPVEEAEPMVARVEPVPVPVSPASQPVSNRPDLLPLDVPAVGDEPAYAFAQPESAPVAPASAEVPASSSLAEYPEVAANVGVESGLAEVLDSDAGLAAPFINDGGPGDMLLAMNTDGRRLIGSGDSEVDPGGSGPVIEPEFGSVSLANLQPYILPGLLGGAASGRPEITEGQGNRTISADFRLLDLGLSTGNSVDAESWSASAAMTWQLTPEWQAQLSIGGIDSQLDVDGFGEVDVTGAAFGGSLDWKKDGYHAALAYEIGLFDQELRRRGPGIYFNADQDATVHRLSFWFTREFEAGAWKHGPVLGLDGSFGSLAAYQEIGGTAMAGRDFTSLTTLLGWQAWGRFDTAAGPMFPNFVAGWRHRPIVPDSAIYQ
ncbi:MAG TPA: autotransporter outer membrane beta-barrel domain-containing protein, partial [Haloferula sp.]